MKLNTALIEGIRLNRLLQIATSMKPVLLDKDNKEYYISDIHFNGSVLPFVQGVGNGRLLYNFNAGAPVIKVVMYSTTDDFVLKEMERNINKIYKGQQEEKAMYDIITCLAMERKTDSAYDLVVVEIKTVFE